MFHTPYLCLVGLEGKKEAMVTMAGGKVSQAGWACTLSVPEAIDPLTRDSGIQTATDQGEFELILSSAG